MKKSILLVAFIFCLIFPGQLFAEFTGKSLATDIEVLYLYDEPANIDWPLIYYLGVEKACRVSLVSLITGVERQCHINNSKDHNIYFYQFVDNESPGFDFDHVLSSLSDWRSPDIIIFGRDLHQTVSLEFEDFLIGKSREAGGVFNIKKILRGVSGGDGGIHINSNKYLDEHRVQLKKLAGELDLPYDELDRAQMYSSYKLVIDNVGGTQSPTFLSGIEQNRFYKLIEKQIENSFVAASMKAALTEYQDDISSLVNLDGLEKINGIFDALESMYRIRQEYYSDVTADTSTTIGKYILFQINSLSSKVFELAGIDFGYKSMLRDTPEGKRLKIVEEINNNGPLKFMAGKISLKPNWSNEIIELPLNQKEIQPFSPLIREYSVNADIESMVRFQPDLMQILGTIKYRGRNIEYKVYTDAYMETALKITLVPDFSIIMPISEKKLDRLVDPIQLKAVITKPSFKEVTANIQIIAPAGTMVGAYKKTVTMPVGTRSFDISIPLVATKKLTSGRKYLIVNLIEDNYIIASDTSLIARGDTEFNDKAKIALLSGPDGLLEDIFVNTGANYRTISNRYLEIRDLDQFDIIALETGCYKNYPALAAVQGKLKKFMERGGTVLVFGQPRNWPADILPVSILTTEKLLPGNQLTVTEDAHPIFKRTGASQFLEAVNSRYKSYPARVAPSESLVLLDDDVSMLSESKFKEGRLIYCGLPLLEMFQNLDFVAITFFTGLINYSGK